MRVLQTSGSLLLTLLIICTLTFAMLGFASKTMLSEKTQTYALTNASVIEGVIKEIATQTNNTLSPEIRASLVQTNLPRISAYLTDSSPSLDLDLSIPDAEFETIFGSLAVCQPEQQALQGGKLICKPNGPLTLLTQTPDQTTSKLTTGLTQAKEGMALLKKITWITFVLAFFLLLGLLALNHNSWSSALAWATSALGSAGFLTLALSVLTPRYLPPFLPLEPPYLAPYLTALISAVLNTLKVYSLIILGIALSALFGSFYLKSK